MHVASVVAKGKGQPYPVASKPKMDPCTVIEHSVEVEDETMLKQSRAVYVQQWENWRQEFLTNMHVLDEGPGRVDEKKTLTTLPSQ